VVGIVGIANLVSWVGTAGAKGGHGVAGSSRWGGGGIRLFQIYCIYLLLVSLFIKCTDIHNLYYK
jgi:hypothetical protein